MNRVDLIESESDELYSLMKPPFSYYGGKQRLSKKIVKLLPPHTVYCEPFCGSSAVYFKKGLPPISNAHYYREVLNDTNKQLINFFKDMQDPIKRAELIDRLDWSLYSQDEHRLSKDGGDSFSFFVNAKMSFSNQLGAGFSTKIISQNSASMYFNSIEHLKLFRNRFKYTTVMNECALNVIKRMDSPQTCFYVDPPYPGANQGHYVGFSQSDFDKLIAVLDSCLGSVVLSCYNNASVPEHWVKHEFEVIASSKGITNENRNHAQKSSFRDNAKRTECVWVKPNSMHMRKNIYLNALNNYNHFQKISKGAIDHA